MNQLLTSLLLLLLLPFLLFSQGAPPNVFSLISAEKFEKTVSPSTDHVVLFVRGNINDDFLESLLKAFDRLAIIYQKESPPIKFSIVLSDGEEVHPSPKEGETEPAPTKLLKRFLSKEISHRFVIFPAQKEDRTCLLSPPPSRSEGIIFQPKESAGQDQLLEDLVDFVNAHLRRHRLPDGSLSSTGQKITELQEGIYRVSEGDSCERVQHIPTKEEFYQKYLSKSKPVVIEGGIAHWPAISKWTNQFLREAGGQNLVHVKLTPDGEFEGCDDVVNWEGHQDRVIPESVKAKLPFPEKVVVRPAGHEIPFSQFMDLIENAQDLSAYLEYTSISSYLPSLVGDTLLPSFADGLHQAHFNIWIGNGKTLGKLHFDPFENLLSQIAGEKHLTIFDPSQSSLLYEGHIPEAILTFDFETKKFSKSTLLESTSMVMSPVDITKPDLEKFPNFEKARPLHCTIKQGDILYLPSFWWHEVQSRPDAQARNIAVNYWFEPFFSKEFPCQDCPLLTSGHALTLIQGAEAAASPLLVEKEQGVNQKEQKEGGGGGGDKKRLADEL